MPRLDRGASTASVMTFCSAAGAIVLAAETDLSMFEGEQAAVADGNSMIVSAPAQSIRSVSPTASRGGWARGSTGDTSAAPSPEAAVFTEMRDLLKR